MAPKWNLCNRAQEKGTVTPQETSLWVSGSLQRRCGSVVACCRVAGTDCSSTCLGSFAGGHHYLHYLYHSFSSVQSLSCVQLFVTPWIAALQASLSISSRSPSKPMSIKLVMPSSHLILCGPLLLLPPIPPSIRAFSNESALHIRWPKYWSFGFSISLSNEHPGLISFRMDWLDLLQSKGLSRVFSNTTVQKHQFFGAQLPSPSNSHIHTWLLEKP